MTASSTKLPGGLSKGPTPGELSFLEAGGRGDYRDDSDLDIFVEMESLEKPYYRHGRVRWLLRGIRVPIDIIVMTPQEVAARRNSTVSLVPVIEREGRVLFES